jgi:predicted branched-subunit amino acid permease
VGDLPADLRRHRAAAPGRLFDEGAAPLLVVVAALAVSAPLVASASSLAAQLPRASTPQRALAAFLVVVPACAVALNRFQQGLSARRRLRYYLGVATAMYLVWQLTTAIGLVAGAGLRLPDVLQFTAPLAMVALLVPSVTSRAARTAVTVASVVALAGVALPAGIGTIAGLGAGLWVGMRDEGGAS